MIFGERVRLAREFCGLTQADLAKDLGTSQFTIHSIEVERVNPSSEIMEEIAARTGFPVSFFSLPPEDFSEGSLLYRAKASRSSKAERKARRAAQVGFGLAMALRRRMKPLPVRLPALAEDAATRATAARVSLGLSPDQPIQNVLNTVERSGVIIVALPETYDDIDAFSLWAGTKDEHPVVAISRFNDTPRLRWTVAHEFGHLIMHRAFPGSDLQTLENEANLFAGEFLMPEGAAREELRPPITLSTVALLKPRWKMSMQALVMRAYHLGIITPRQRTHLFQQLTQRGWRMEEPRSPEIAEERPRALPQLAERFYGSPINYAKLAADVNLTPMMARSFVEACSFGGGGGGGNLLRFSSQAERDPAQTTYGDATVRRVDDVRHVL